MLSTQTGPSRKRPRPAGLTFAAVVLIAIGCARIISAIYYFADSNRVSNVSGGPFAHHLVYWGVWDLLIAALALWGGFALLKQQEIGFVLGYTFAGLLIVQSLLLLGASPWYGFAALALATLIIYELSANDTAKFEYGRVPEDPASWEAY
jgi:hypothetical protein